MYGCFWCSLKEAGGLKRKDYPAKEYCTSSDAHRDFRRFLLHEIKEPTIVLISDTQHQINL